MKTQFTITYEVKVGKNKFIKKNKIIEFTDEEMKYYIDKSYYSDNPKDRPSVMRQILMDEPDLTEILVDFDSSKYETENDFIATFIGWPDVYYVLEPVT